MASPASLELDELRSPPRAEGEESPATDGPLDRTAVSCLLAQHLLSTWGTRSFEFACFLYISVLWPTLLPASIFGFLTVGAAIVLAGLIGERVDVTPRLRFMRTCIVLQKVTVALSYGVFLVLFLVLRERVASSLKSHDSVVWLLFATLAVTGSILNLSTIAISVSLERDWVTAIAGSDSGKLTTLNAYLRRIDLLSKLLAPLFVSLLTVVVSYPFSIAFMLAYSVVTLAIELVWIGIVYRRWPVLATTEATRLEAHRALPQVAPPAEFATRLSRLAKQGMTSLRQQLSDWREFLASPIFPSSLAVSLLYLTVLSFDGTMLTWLKSHAYGDAFLAGMRGICVVTGLLGTVCMPLLEKKIGLIRTGSWAIWSEVIMLVPVLLSFFVGAATEGQRGAPWNTAMLFTGMALSRLGLWCFDLCQLKELQITLQDHPRRNSLTALQFSLQNSLDLAKFVLTMVLSQPSEFKYAAAVSFASVCLGAASYMFYVKRQRGHLVHLEWGERLFLLRKQI